MINRLWIFALLLLVLPASALARHVEITPLPREGQEVRYESGVPTVSTSASGDAQVFVLPMDKMKDGGLQFKVIVYNKRAASDHFGVEDVSLLYGEGRAAEPLTLRELRRRAKTDALFKQIIVGVAAAALSGSQGDTILSSRRGRGPTAGQVATLAIGLGGIGLIQHKLHRQLTRLDDEILQTTTIDRGNFYGGKVVMERVGLGREDTVSLVVNFGGQDYVFDFLVKR